MNWIALPCKKVTELEEKRKVMKFGPLQFVQYKLHLTMCKACRSYGKQSEIIDKELATYYDSINSKKHNLSDSKKQDIKSSLKDY